jgi:galactokinase
MGGEQLRTEFEKMFGQPPEVVAVAPGRVNLIGEHTDYNEGFVFPAAIDRQLYVAAAVTEGPTTLHSCELGEGHEFDANAVRPGDTKGWAAYAAGIAWVLRQEHGARPPEIMALVSSDVPIGSGVSSSAAIELAFGVAWNELAGLGLSNIELAKAGQRCENGFIGLQSGIMDQMASAMGRGGHALFLDTRSLEIEYAPIPHGLTIVICDTGKPRALTDSAYNERRAQCEAASVAMGVATLRDATLADLEAQRPVMDPVIYRRAKHVITENARCQDFKKVLDAGDIEAIGVLMRASHESLRDDYEVSSPELDAMAEAAWVAPGCVGARMTGAGFGGACVALVREDLLAQFVQSASVAYTASSSLAGQFLPCKAVDGARALS